MPLPHSDSRAHPKSVSFDLSNPSKWEAVFEGRGGAASADGGAVSDDRAGLSSAAGDRTGSGLKSAPRTPKTPGLRYERLSSKPQGGGASGDTSSPPRTADSYHGDGGGGDEDGGVGDSGLVPEVPPSWVPKLSIPRDAFDMRCPRGSKLSLYSRCQHEIYALFGDCRCERVWGWRGKVGGGEAWDEG